MALSFHMIMIRGTCHKAGYKFFSISKFVVQNYYIFTASYTPFEHASFVGYEYATFI